MPAGLDGNPDPIRSPQRDAVLQWVTDRVFELPQDRVVVGVDGRSGTGKSTFADELAVRLRERGRLVVRSTTDSFHRPRVDRLRRGPTSAVGYVRDSHQVERMVDELLVPFRSGARNVLVSAFDEPTDAPFETTADIAPEAVLVVDGLFIHRDEFAPHWDLSAHLVADDRLDSAWLEFLLSGLPTDPTLRATELDRRLALARWPRYREGWSSYDDDVAPRRRATVVIDNNDVAHPRLLQP